jgi:DNA polymerase-3 subunit alpha
MTRRGMMRVVELDDGSGRMEVTVFNELYESRRSVLKVDEPLIVSARVEHDDYSGSLRGSALEILTLAEARLRYAKAVVIRFRDGVGEADDHGDRLLARLQQAFPSIDESKQGLRVRLKLSQRQQVCEIALGSRYSVWPQREEFDRLTHALWDMAEATVRYH